MSNGKYVFVYYKDYAETVTNNFKSFLDNDLYIDLVFVCRNNKKVGAHQVVLGCLSKFFYSIFIDNVNTAKEKVLHIYVPDIRAKIMKYILQFIYSGKAMLNKEELQEFNEDIKLLGMPLDHFSVPNEATENETQFPKTCPNESTTTDTSKVPRAVHDTVDLTDTHIIEDQENDNNLPNKEAVIPPVSTTASDANAHVVPVLPIIDENPINTSSIKISKSENHKAKTSFNSNSNLKIVPENDSNLIKSDTKLSLEPDTKVSLENTSKNGDLNCKRKTNTVGAPSAKRKILTASINLDGSSDEDDIITIS